MRNTLVKLAFICSLLPALAFAGSDTAPPAGDDMPTDAWSAPGSGYGHHRGGGKHRFSHRDRMMKLMEKVNVTDAQKKQIDALLKANEDKIRSSFQAQHETWRELHHVGFSADYSDDKVKALLAKLQPIHEQAVLEKARLDNAIYKLLTPEQQKKLQDIMAQWEQKRAGKKK